jgi:NADPH2:quinone reductase
MSAANPTPINSPSSTSEEAMQIKSIKIDQFGGPEVLKLVSTPCPEPGPGEVRVGLTAIGINLIDTYHRTGLYPMPLPTGLGCEGAGVIEALGTDVDHLQLGDRVGFCSAIGAYSEAIILPQGGLVKIPDGVSDQQAAAVLLKGMTVDYLFNETYPLHGGETVLFHAAAGGVGLLACQWARHLGVTLIGTASTPEKCQLAVDHGAAQCLQIGQQNIAERLAELGPDGGFGVVYDSVGKASYELSLNALAPLGMLVSFGNASGPIEGVSPAALAAAGSVYFTRPTLGTHLARPGWMQRSADRLFGLIAEQVLDVQIHQTYGLDEVAQAHRDLEGRKTTGCSVILP